MGLVSKARKGERKMGKNLSDSTRYFEVVIEGKQLLMHNGQLAGPLNEWTKKLKEVTGKRKKSDADHEKIMEIEFQGGLYYDDKLGPVIPGFVIDGCLVAGAKKRRLGKTFQSCVHAADDLYKLEYDGPRDREGLWSDPRFRDYRGVQVNRARVYRTRPKFTNWRLKFVVELFPCELNPDDVKEAVINGGAYSGIGDFRPRFGLFNLVSFKELKQTTRKAA